MSPPPRRRSPRAARVPRAPAAARRAPEIKILMINQRGEEEGSKKQREH
ncbi:hypothetical protein HJG60_004573 [Phyllostomus discolor]|uniref:Uncharacterized protein n=1 Tax=Phyllostomus discolor TaxID=89673 RepID=A0A834DN92_9CHIR|nr:hypothetical protein HJG60_004573 [Phyllostomus discolor]